MASRVQRALKDLPDGSVLVIESTDGRAKQEYQQLAEQTSNELLAIETGRERLLRKEYTTYFRVRDE